MQIPDDVILPRLRELLQWFLQRGYVLQDERYDAESFGDALLVLAKSDVLIRIVRDRGQWFLSVAIDSDGSWFAPVDWDALLESSTPSVDALPFDTEAELLQRHLERIEIVAETFGDVERERLRTLRSGAAGVRSAMKLGLRQEEALTPSVQALIKELHKRGYATRDAHYDAPGFGDAVLVLTKHQTIVRLTSSRSSPSAWTIEVGALSSKEYFRPSVWHAFFEASLASPVSPSFDGEAQLLSTHLNQIEARTADFGKRELLKLQEWDSRKADVAGE